ncbi:MAG: helix-turn-helix domain-containing protein [Rectinemataceae bacterium]
MRNKEMALAPAAGEVEDYLLKTFGLRIKIKPLTGVSLPFYLSNLFSLGTTEIKGSKLLLCTLSSEEKPSPAQFKKYAVELYDRTGLEAAFVLPGLSSWDRTRLIEGRIAFIVPGRQIYLPTLLIDLREHFARERGKPDRLSYPAQFLLIIQILYGRVEGKTVRELSREFAFSATTMSRAVRELLALDLVETKEGKARPLHFALDKRGLWATALAYLQSPVKSMWYTPSVSPLLGLPYAGMSALAHLSMMNEDERPCYAVSYATAKPLIEKGIFHAQPLKDTDHLIEVWAYDPCAMSGKDSSTVDPLSLYLSLAGENDERVRKAIEGLIKELL